MLIASSGDESMLEKSTLVNGLGPYRGGEHGHLEENWNYMKMVKVMKIKFKYVKGM